MCGLMGRLGWGGGWGGGLGWGVGELGDGGIFWGGRGMFGY